MNVSGIPRPSFRLRGRRFRIMPLASVLLVACVGSYILRVSQAATPTISIDAEQGARSAQVQPMADVNAHNGQAVKFGSGGTGGCTGAPNTPGGTDPWGGCWPGPNNTGVPAGVTLTPYTGSCTITAANTVIDAKLIDSCDRLDIGPNATNVLIKNSRVNTVVYNDDVGSYNGSVTLQDSEVHAGSVTYGAVTYKNITLIRTEVTGGQHNVLCSASCNVHDSYLHDPYVQGATHNNGFISNGGSDYLIEHSTVSCNVPTNATGGGCSGDVSWFGDFGPISNATLNKSLLTANTELAYCLYAGHDTKPYGTQAHHITVTNNVFQKGTNNKCGAYGPYTNYYHDISGNAPPNSIWSGNVWSDGTAL